MDDQEVLLSIATVSTPDGTSRDLKVKKRPSARELTLLFALCEHVSRTISMDDICHRLKASPTAIRVAATRLRKKLCSDWAIMSDPNQGMRIIYTSTDLAEASRTHISFDREAIKRRQSLDTRRKISESMKKRASV